MMGWGELRVIIARRGGTDAGDRARLERLAREASGNPSLILTRRCSHCGSSGHGAPFAPGLFVSLSRAVDTVVFALSPEPVGIDIESVENVALADIDRVAFTPAERARIAASPASRLMRAELWAGKEAVLKLRGTGLRVEPSSFQLADVSEAVHPFTPRPGLVGAVAGAGRVVLLR